MHRYEVIGTRARAIYFLTHPEVIGHPRHSCIWAQCHSSPAGEQMIMHQIFAVSPVASAIALLLVQCEQVNVKQMNVKQMSMQEEGEDATPAFRSWGLGALVCSSNSYCAHHQAWQPFKLCPTHQRAEAHTQHRNNRPRPHSGNLAPAAQRNLTNT